MIVMEEAIAFLTANKSVVPTVIFLLIKNDDIALKQALAHQPKIVLSKPQVILFKNNGYSKNQ